MYFGRKQIGDLLAVPISCTNASSVPVDPDTPPSVSVYDSSGTRVSGPVSVPPKDQVGTTGMFEHRVRLDDAFSVGAYSVLFSWTSGVFNGSSAAWFEIMPGGHSSGAVFSMEYLRRPVDRWIVYETESDEVFLGKNPRI